MADEPEPVEDAEPTHDEAQSHDAEPTHDEAQTRDDAQRLPTELAFAPLTSEPPASETPASDPPADQPPSTEVVQTIQRRNWTRGVVAVVGVIVVLVGIGWGAGAIANSFAPPEEVRILESIEASADAESAAAPAKDGPKASLHWSDSVGQVVLTASGLPDLAEGTEFEVWYVRGKSIFSAGTFTSTGGEATVEVNPEFQRGDTVEVTVEKRGGSDEGPTSEALISIPTKKG